MEETTIVDFNQHRGGQPKLVAIYPKEGTFYSDSPLIVLDAPWVSPAERDGARAFGKFLADDVDAGLAARSGFRPPAPGAKPVAPISPQNGADPSQPKRVLGLPEPRVLDTVRRTWRADRKPANVLLVVDTSGSMVEEDRLERAKQGLKTFLRQLSPNDRVGLASFNEEIHPLVDLAPVRQNAGQLRSTIDSLIADGGTAFYDAAIRGFDDVRGLNDRDRINAVVLLTDGEDTDSSASVDEAVSRMAAQGDSENSVRVFTIAYSASAEGAEAGLKRIAAASGGQEYTGDTEDIELVYRSISSFF
jgi:Ca-activated chloride channel family protein